MNNEQSIEPLISSAFDSAITLYHRIFNEYYPSHNSVGFTERNLTCNFVSAIQMMNPNDAFSWFEAPIDLKRNKHVDAVVFIPSRNAMFIIESKRFSNLNQKKDEFKNDIKRIKNPEHISILKKGLTGNFDIKTIYGIILADIWLETESKKVWYQNWGHECSMLGSELTRVGEFNNLCHPWTLKDKYKILLAAFPCGG